MREARNTSATICQGCGLEIDGEPFTHMSALHVLFIAHDFNCCMVAYRNEVLRLVRSRPRQIERWLDATGHNTYG